MSTIIPFRDRLRQVLPPWLRFGFADQVRFAIGIQLDAVGDALVAGVKLRFPGYYSDDSLPLLGRERRIRRGRSETSRTYAARLTRWLIDHRGRGGPYALLAQVHAHYAPNSFPVELIYRSGRRYSMDAAGNVMRDDVDFESTRAIREGYEVPPAEQWARWWLIYDWPEALPSAGLWSEPGTKWGDPTTLWGYRITPDEVEDLRLVPREWNAAHAMGRIVLISGLTPDRRLELAV